MFNKDIKELVESANSRIEDFRNLVQSGMIPLDGDFFPSVHYPPITMYDPITEEELFKTYTLPPDGRFDVYVHIPFCIKRCLFCHYPSLYNAPHSEKDRYLDALEREMDIYMRLLGIEKIKARSILLGGGTPTDLTPDQLRHFLDFFVARLDMSKCRQFNYDVDPSTLVGTDGVERLRIMRSYGVDRLTIGVQSFNDKILKKMNRSHDSAVALESIKNSQEMGYKVNIEFIFGYPGQTIENWVEVLEKALSTDVDEIQFYRLKVIPYGDQEGTIQKIKTIKPDEVPPVEEAILMKQIAIDLLAKHGYNENLRRVFTKKRSSISLYAYNQCCNLYDEIGFGLTAFSSLRDRFGLNTQYFDEYYQAVDEGRLPLNRGLVRGIDEQIRWAIILPLKNYYVRKKYFKKVTGVPIEGLFCDKFDALKESGLITENDKHIELTTLGAFFADEVVEQFHQRPYIPFPKETYTEGPFNPYLNPTILNT
ncbi:MAG: coproporphyrinogen III oxidase family protein [Candidatus Aminicenantes bacterium]|nr:coproporphyrinogen III oxidase family protein [Candidatus Aminicenantes bacterium]